MDPFAGPAEKKPAAVPVGGMRHVHFDGSPESAGAVLWAISQTDRRVYVHAASDELLVLPRALQDVGGDLGRRGDARLGEPVWVPHYDVAVPQRHHQRVGGGASEPRLSGGAHSMCKSRFQRAHSSTNSPW